MYKKKEHIYKERLHLHYSPSMKCIVFIYLSMEKLLASIAPEHQSPPVPQGRVGPGTALAQCHHKPVATGEHPSHQAMNGDTNNGLKRIDIILDE